MDGILPRQAIERLVRDGAIASAGAPVEADQIQRGVLKAEA